MKIAINKCFGGFDLSNKAIKRYLELIGKGCYLYKQTKYHHSDGVVEFTKCNPDDETGLFTEVSTKDLGEVIEKVPDEFSFYYGDIERTDSNLIQVIEELSDAASGRFGNVQVVDIPDDIEWEISNYDGIETVEEKHRSW